MTDRNLYFKVNHSLEGPFYRHLGVLQGCVLSSFLYLIYVIYLNKHITSPNDIIQFADDTIIILHKKLIKGWLKAIEKNINSIIDYFHSIGLEIAPHKSQLIIFTKTKNISPNLGISIKGNFIKNEKVVKYLGIWIDTKLEWNTYAQYIIQQMQKSLDIIKVSTKGNLVERTPPNFTECIPGTYPKHIRL